MDGNIKISTQIIPFGCLNYTQNNEEIQKDIRDKFVYGGYETTAHSKRVEILFDVVED
ncbi:MAG: hypothetical protein ACP5PV_03770 [Methanothrix sp.]